MQNQNPGDGWSQSRHAVCGAGDLVLPKLVVLLNKNSRCTMRTNGSQFEL